MTRGTRGAVCARAVLPAISGAAWALLILQPHSPALPVYCSLPSAAAMPRPSLDALLWLNPPGSLAAAWALMLTAMMLPLLSVHIRSICERSLARRRARSVLVFLTGYAAVWMTAGAMLITIVLAVRLTAGASVLPAAVALLAAFAWQCSPLKQRCLNRGHAAPAMRAFGLAADVDVLRFGIVHGAWCVGSCWLLMLLPLLLPEAHLAAMAAVALWFFAERLEVPRMPRWEIRIPRKAGRIAFTLLRTGIGRSAKRAGFAGSSSA